MRSLAAGADPQSALSGRHGPCSSEKGRLLFPSFSVTEAADGADAIRDGDTSTRFPQSLALCPSVSQCLRGENSTFAGAAPCSWAGELEDLCRSQLSCNSEGVGPVYGILQSMDVAMRALMHMCLGLCLALAGSVALAQASSRDAALSALKSADATERQRAAARLADVGSMEDVPVLLAALRDPDPGVRAVAEQAIRVIWSRSGDPQVDRLFEQALDEMGAGRFRESIALFSRVIEMKPEFAEGWNKRATVYFLIGEYEKSLKDCDEVIKRNPQHFGALAGYGQIYLRLGEPEKALAYFKRALAVDPNLHSVEFQIRMLEQLLESQRNNQV